MDIFIGGAAIIAVVIFSILSCIYIVLDWKRQKNIVRDAEYRKVHGEFDIERYAQPNIMIKQFEWLRQHNGGILPETYRKKIKYIDSFEGYDGVNCIIKGVKR